MTYLRYTLLALAAATALAIPVVAQQPNRRDQQQSNSHVKQDIEAAKQSNDPARMRAALDEAEKALTSISGTAPAVGAAPDAFAPRNPIEDKKTPIQLEGDPSAPQNRIEYGGGGM